MTGLRRAAVAAVALATLAAGSAFAAGTSQEVKVGDATWKVTTSADRATALAEIAWAPLGYATEAEFTAAADKAVRAATGCGIEGMGPTVGSRPDERLAMLDCNG